MKLRQILVAALLAATFSAPVLANESQNSTQTSPSMSNNTTTTPSANGSETMNPNTTMNSMENNGKQQEKKGMDKTASNTPVNLNTASVEELMSLKGIGQKRAEAIIQYRTSNGKFASLEDLLKVKGMNKNVIEKNRDRLMVG